MVIGNDERQADGGRGGRSTALRDLGDGVVYLVLRAVLAFIGFLPRSAAVRFSLFLSAVDYHLAPLRRSIVMDNLALAFGSDKSGDKSEGKSDDELRSIAKRFYSNMGLFVAEFARMRNLDERYVEEKVTFRGLNHIDDALAKGKGVVLLTAHFGNWELLGAVLALKGYRLSTVARPLGNRFLNGYLDRTRLVYGNGVIEKKRAIRRMMELLREGRIVGILLDQRTNLKEGVMVDFFGRPAPTSKGLAAVVARTSTPVVPVFMLREDATRFVVECAAPVETVSTGDAEADVAENTARFTRVIESYIRRRPDHWLWFHSRWGKSRLAEEKRRRRKVKKNRERERAAKASGGGGNG